MRFSDTNWKRVVGLVVLVALVAPFVVYAVPQVVGANHGYVVLSDSMSPTFGAGDVVIVDGVDPQNIEQGDVITFESPDGDSLVTHRVVDVIREDGSLKFETKGDANEEADAALVPAENVKGVVWFHIPLIGYVLQFAQSDLGTVVFVIVPAVLLGLNEIWALYKAADPAESAEQEETTDEDEWEWEGRPRGRGDD